MIPSHVFQNGTSLFQGLVEHARKTVRGSADDIGWFQQDQSLPPTEDGTARFLEILDSVRSAKISNWFSMFGMCTSVFHMRCNMSFISFCHFIPRRKNEHKLPDSMVYLLVPGLFSNHGPLYFVKTKSYFSKMGLACHIAKIHCESSVIKDARDIKE